MIELSKHIESLLLKHDCVIVPGLGGFVTQYVPARRIDNEMLFLPPCRSVGFNPQLTLNDGLLVQSYMQAYDTNYPETIKLINNSVQQLKMQLQEEGEYELSGIGKLTLGVGGKYNFIPCEAGVLSPELYGLDAVTQTLLSKERKAESTDIIVDNGKQKKVRLKRTEKSYTISINRELVNYIAAAIVAVFFYCLWVTPVSDTTKTEQQAASMVYEQLFQSSSAKTSTSPIQATKAVQTAHPMQQQTATEAEAEAQPSATVSPATETTQPSTKVGTQSEATKTITSAPENNDKKYTIVLASAISEANASSFSKELKKEGFHEVTPYRKGRMVRVIYGHYASEKDAHEALSKLHRHSAFSDAWVMQTK